MSYNSAYDAARSTQGSHVSHSPPLSPDSPTRAAVPTTETDEGGASTSFQDEKERYRSSRQSSRSRRRLLSSDSFRGDPNLVKGSGKLGQLVDGTHYLLLMRKKLHLYYWCFMLTLVLFLVSTFVFCTWCSSVDNEGAIAEPNPDHGMQDKLVAAWDCLQVCAHVICLLLCRQLQRGERIVPFALIIILPLR